jgi:hypothetical protein
LIFNPKKPDAEKFGLFESFLTMGVANQNRSLYTPPQTPGTTAPGG